VNNKECTD